MKKDKIIKVQNINLISQKNENSNNLTGRTCINCGIRHPLICGVCTIMQL